MSLSKQSRCYRGENILIVIVHFGVCCEKCKFMWIKFPRVQEQERRVLQIVMSLEVRRKYNCAICMCNKSNKKHVLIQTVLCTSVRLQMVFIGRNQLIPYIITCSKCSDKNPVTAFMKVMQSGIIRTRSRVHQTAKNLNRIRDYSIILTM
jgi:hypothetical protein